MAIAHVVPGKALIKVGTGTGSPPALEELGYTVNGAQIVYEGYQIEIPGDENGGDQGPPLEIQDLGEKATVRLELVHYDEAIAAKLTRLRGGTMGSPAAAGTLIFSGDKFFRLLIHATAQPHNFPCAVLLKRPREMNVGTKYQTLICEFECYKHPTTGVLKDTTTT